jgi:4-amino-4-deoxychorismate lyase
MCLLFESIKVINGVACNKDYHEARIKRAQQSLFGKSFDPVLGQVKIPQNLKPDTVYKLRITYDTQIREYHFSEYHPKNISSLQCVVDNHISYSHKFEDRSRIQNLFNQKGQADDIIIIKNGLVTDSSYTNLAFLKDGNWYTPDTPLLPGTKRALYLEKGMMEETRITLGNLKSFEGVCLINAFLDLNKERLISKVSVRLPTTR